jgi:hypothetical protein
LRRIFNREGEEGEKGKEEKRKDAWRRSQEKRVLTAPNLTAGTDRTRGEARGRRNKYWRLLIPLCRLLRLLLWLSQLGSWFRIFQIGGRFGEYAAVTAL